MGTQLDEIKKGNVGKTFTTDGKNTWELIWVGESMGMDDNTIEIAYEMKNQKTGEVLTQLLFSPQKGG